MAPKKGKQPLSKYNKFVKKYFNDHTGATMEAAAEAWNKKTGSKTSPNPKPKRKKNVTNKKKKTRKGGIRLPGGLGPKGIAMGALGLLIVPRITGITSPGGSKLATGLALRTLKIGGGGPLAAVGIMELALQYLGGGLAGFNLGGGGGGGTDF